MTHPPQRGNEGEGPRAHLNVSVHWPPQPAAVGAYLVSTPKPPPISLCPESFCSSVSVSLSCQPTEGKSICAFSLSTCSFVTDCTCACRPKQGYTLTKVPCALQAWCPGMGHRLYKSVKSDGHMVLILYYSSDQQSTVKLAWVFTGPICIFCLLWPSQGSV